MQSTPDESERARAAVSLACLAWLRHTGPAPGGVPDGRQEPRTVPFPAPTPPDRAGHPLWDRWVDG